MTNWTADTLGTVFSLFSEDDGVSQIVLVHKAFSTSEVDIFFNCCFFYLRNIGITKLPSHSMLFANYYVSNCSLDPEHKKESMEKYSGSS